MSEPELTRAELLHALANAYNEIDRLRLELAEAASLKPGPTVRVSELTASHTRAKEIAQHIKRGGKALPKKATRTPTDAAIISALPKGKASAIKLNQIASLLNADKHKLGLALKSLREAGKAKMVGKLNGAKHYR